MPLIRRIHAALAASLLVLSVAACGNSSGTPTSGDPNSTQNSNAPVGYLVVSPATVKVTVGQTKTLNVLVYGATGAVLTGRVVTWSSSAPGIALVTNGSVTGEGVGIATITAASGGQSVTAQVTVTP